MLLYSHHDRLAIFLGVLISLVLVNIPVTNADASNLNPTGEGCVDPKGYLACYEAQRVQATSCVGVVNKTCDAQQLTECVASCYKGQLAANLGCWIQSCWNRVYSCEYQATAIQYLSGTDLMQESVSIPFYPAPAEASGACSCNLGYVYGNQTVITKNPCASAAASGNTQLLNDCFCCNDFVKVSNMLNTCPTSDLSLLGIENSISSSLSVVTPYTQDNCAILDQDPSQCTSRYGVTPLGPKFHNLLNLDPRLPGKDPLSNLPGQAFTDFGKDPVTLTLFPGYTSVITGAPYNERNAAATGSAALGGATVASGTAVPSGTGGASVGPDGTAGGTSGSSTSAAATTSSTSKPNGASSGSSRTNTWWSLAMVLAYALTATA